MKKTTTILALGFLLLAALPALSGDADVTLTGWITDACCGAKNANAEGKDCTIACNKNGMELMLHADGKNYKIDDQKAALKHVGHEVVVTGTMNEDVLQVASIKAAKVEKDKS
jgi:hypothetical protein